MEPFRTAMCNDSMFKLPTVINQLEHSIIPLRQAQCNNSTTFIRLVNGNVKLKIAYLVLQFYIIFMK